MDHLSGSAIDFIKKKTELSNILDRFNEHQKWWDKRYENGLDPYSKTIIGEIKPTCVTLDRKGKEYKGVNFANQDYLSMASNQKVKDAAKAAIDKYGVHSAGSPTLMGNTEPSRELEKELASFLEMKDCTVFATGWSAGYGAVKALVGKGDHIILDKLCHACLIEGALNSGAEVHIINHLCSEELEQKLSEIRLTNSKAGILVVTESLFSMDSDVPDLKTFQELSHRYSATLFVDMAHDLGCIAENGRGFLEKQKMVGKIDIVMGSFSKTFASNGGFVCSNNEALKTALRFSCGPHTFSNAISPVQASIVREVLKIIRSEEGKLLRKKMYDNASYLREKLSSLGGGLVGEPSAIIPLCIGECGYSRRVVKACAENGLILNLIEHPAVKKDSSRIRLQVMAEHTKEHLDFCANTISKALEDCKEHSCA